MTPHDPFDTSRIDAALDEIEALLDQLHAPWTLAGALAADKYRAEERLTTDGDLLTDWRVGLIEGLEALGFELKVTRDGDEVHLIRTRRPDAAVDVIVATTDYQRLAIQRGIHGGTTRLAGLAGEVDGLLWMVARRPSASSSSLPPGRVRPAAGLGEERLAHVEDLAVVVVVEEPRHRRGRRRCGRSRSGDLARVADRSPTGRRPAPRGPGPPSLMVRCRVFTRERRRSAALPPAPPHGRRSPS